MNKKFKFKHSFILMMVVIIIIGIITTGTMFAIGSDIKNMHTFDFTPTEKSTAESLFTSAASSQVTWESGSSLGVSDDYVLKGTHTGSDYTGANNAIHLTFPKVLPAGYVYNVEVSFYVPSALNQGKSTITGPGVVLNGLYGNSSYKLPSSPGTIDMDKWKTVNINTPVMTDDFSSIDFRFVVNTGANHPDVWYVDHIVISQVGDPQPIPTWNLTIPSLANTYKNDFLLGNIIEPNQLDAKNTNMYKAYYNCATAENAMKPATLSTAKGTYNFTNADSIINWSQQNNIDIHGHTLVWHDQSPNWLNKNADGTPLTRNEARQNLQDYISTVAGHFAGKVISWDVVNEAFNGGSLPFTNWKDVARKTSPWYTAYANGSDTANGESGADYIYDSFVFARQTDPKAILYYNDYNETDDWKREAISQMAEDLNAKWHTDSRNTEPNRKLIEGVGMQSHYYTDSLKLSQVEASIQRFIKAGLKISVSELDICYGSYNGPTYTTLTKEQQVTQAILYAQLFEIYKAYANHIQRVTIWGKADSQSWRNTQSPLLFDSMFAPKQAFYAAINPTSYLKEQGIASRPMSDLAVSINKNTVVSGVSTKISVKSTATDLGNYKTVTYLAKDGVKYSDEVTLVDGTKKITVPKTLEVGKYSVVVDVYERSNLLATKSIPLTVRAAQIVSAKLSIDNKKITKDKTGKLTVTRAKLENGKAVNISKTTIQYYSSNTSVAIVSAEGNVTAVKCGNAELSAKVTLDGITVKSNKVAIKVVKVK